ncbi:MAG TPA: FliM/FliN family flagellar motor switch protein [Candidatus Saccharimonadales bacterium]|nr:FliM/FliN family flagellar motor switch protein [Candidatus Saccharimonadales bacterium]
MEKVLNQEEIDAMFRAALGRTTGTTASVPSYQPCDFKQAGQIKKDQVRAISNLHEGFARNLTNALGAYLRVIFEVNLVSVEQLTYREFLQRIPDLAYLATFQVRPMGATATLDLEPSLVFPMIDLLLGGVGRANEQERDITEIEEGIMEGIVRILCGELQTAWASLGTTFEFDERLQPTQLQRLMPPGDKTLCLSFEIRMPESHGVLNVAFPAVASNALLRKLDQDGGYSRHRGPSAARQRMIEHALGFPFEFSLGLPATRLPIRTLSGLKAGDVIPFRHRTDTPAEGTIAGRALYKGFPIRAGNQRASKILEMMPTTPPTQSRVSSEDAQGSS